MKPDRRRAALLACCILGVLVAAPFFPAAGYGDTPDREAVDGSPPIGDLQGDDSEPADDGADGGDEDDSGNDGDEDASDEENGDERSDGDTEPNRSDDTVGQPPSGGASDTLDWGTVLGVLVAGLALTILALVVMAGRAAMAERDGMDASAVESDASLGRLWGRFPGMHETIRAVPRVTMIGTISLVQVGATASRSTSSAARSVGDLFRQTGGAVATGVQFSVGGLFDLGRSSGLLSSVSGGFAWIPASLARSSARESDSNGRVGSTATRRTRTQPTQEDDSLVTVEHAWATFEARAPVRRRSVATPGESAMAAIEDGFPERAVRRLTETFREVRYGGLPETDTRRRIAWESTERISDYDDENEPTRGDDT